MEQPEGGAPAPELADQAVASSERAHELVHEVRRLMEQGNLEAALQTFNQLHPVDRGETLVHLDEGPRRELLTTLDPSETAAILEQLEPEEAVTVSDSMGDQALSHILDEASPDVAADILRHLPIHRSGAILRRMEESAEVLPLLQHPDDTAGGLMTPDYPVVREGLSAGNALDQLRLIWPNSDNIGALFVVDDEGRLVGSLSITRLALARTNAVVTDLFNPSVISVTADTDQEECARVMERYNLNELPVVDQEGKLMGAILAEDMVDVVEKEATEDMYRMASVAGERVFGPLQKSLRRRLPWLYLNLATAFLAASVVGLFESTISRLVTLAVFLPVVAGQGGIGGTQTVTLVVRSMALGEVPGRLGMKVLAREVALGVINGGLLGVVVGLLAFLWKGNLMLAVVLALAMLGNMLVAGLTGAGVPLFLRKLHLDPAVSSAVFVTTFTDVLGFLMFLGLAALSINLLL